MNKILIQCFIVLLFQKSLVKSSCNCLNGFCVDGSCRCSPGFGSYTSTICKECNCGTDSACSFSAYGVKMKTCHCKPGYNDHGGSCVDCECGRDSNCTFTYRHWLRGYEKECICQPGYRDQDGKCVGTCSSNPCKNGGTCEDMKNGYECTCTSEYTGEDCTEKISSCSSNPCKNGGQCVDYNGSFKCNCVGPYSGETCEINCSCMNGNCENGICRCFPGFGRYNNDICLECNCGGDSGCYFDQYGDTMKVCICKPGYTDQGGKCVDCECGRDSNCTITYDNINGGWKKVCICKPGYRRENGKCIGTCSSNPCKNGGTCEDVKNGYECTCTSEYTGEDCTEKVSDSCSCKNGHCVKDALGKWKCMCFRKHSLQGKDCELCDCGKKGKCTFTESFSEQTRSIEYEKKCVCSTGYADRYGTCTECICGVKGKCEFENGKKKCDCVESYAEINGVCRECNCGEGGYCEFQSGEKICTCYNGFLFDGNICREECYGDEDCVDNKKCVEESNDGSICRCADGLSGSNCAIQEWCEDNGKFAQCRGINGTCGITNETRSVTCICPQNKKLHPEENRCRETCSSAFECQNGGKCEERGGQWFCSCKPGLIGDRCETVFDCTPEGTYKGCVTSGGACSYDGHKATCECPGNEIFNNKTLICEECDCGAQGTCKFVDGIKTCDCARGYIEKSEMCREGCYGDDNCGDNQKCVEESDEWKICQCADGLSGRNCEVKEWCENNGKFKYCRGLNGTCEYIKKIRSIDCTCVSGAKLHPLENRCKEVCTNNNECENGGICENHFCTCKEGIMGEKCETIFDCTERGKFRGCIRTKGKCSHDGSRAVCECPLNEKYHDTEHTCKECDCGPKGSCKFENGQKKCDCLSGFAVKDGICTATCSNNDDCKDYQVCKEENGWKICMCADGLSGANCEKKDFCESDGKFKNCKGENGTCKYIKDRRSVTCFCSTGKTLHPVENRCRDTCSSNDGCINGGTCNDKFCDCEPGLFGDKCQTVFDCMPYGKYKDCESSGGKCYFEGFRAMCECSENKILHDKELICKVCDCGENGSCAFEGDGKICKCDANYSENKGKCERCDCGEEGRCAFINGEKTCDCGDGYSEQNGKCERIQQPSFT